jgi:hypothetical protein
MQGFARNGGLPQNSSFSNTPFLCLIFSKRFKRKTLENTAFELKKEENL